MLRVILTIVQVFACFAIIGLVLLQRGKGADAGAGFGAGASGTVFGARGAATALSRATAFFAAIFMINSLLLTYVGTRAVAAPPKTILDTIGEKADKANATKPGVTQTIPAPDAPAAGEQPGSDIVAACDRRCHRWVCDDACSCSCGDACTRGGACGSARYRTGAAGDGHTAAERRCAEVASGVEKIKTFFDCCRRGGIGRHTSLRGWRREVCEFESRRRHQIVSCAATIRSITQGADC